METNSIKLNRFSLYAWTVLAYNVAVILWGTFVRATGSGAGCGGHWPLCNGEVIPAAPQVATLIEFAHRASSGLSGLFVAGLTVWAFLRYSRGSRVRWAAAASLTFIVIEALIGAGLVLFGWVAGDVSVARTISISLHLVNTFLLLGSLTLTAWWASGGPGVELKSAGPRKWWIMLALVGVILIGVTGAITALGDTLFPPESLAAGLQQDASPAANFMIRLRVLHPLLAATVGMYLLALSSLGRAIPFALRAVRLDQLLRGVTLLQLAAGMVNLFLLAPIWMQLVHLLLADSVWIALVLFSVALLAESISGTHLRDPETLAARPGSKELVLSRLEEE